MLNANVSFLAIQSNDISEGGVDPGHRLNAQRASYFSIVNSIGSIVLGLLLIREHNASLNVRRVFFLSLLFKLTDDTVWYSLPISYLHVLVSSNPPHTPYITWKPSL